MVVRRARLVTAVPLGPRAFLPSAHVSQRRKVEPVVDRSGPTELARMAAELDELARFADAQEKKATQLQTALEEIHFLFGDKAESLMHAVRHLLCRSRLTVMEVKVLHGLARQIRWHVANHRSTSEGEPGA